MVLDLVHHVVNETGHRVTHWGVWNEPDGLFWNRNLNDYLRLYEVCARAVKAVSPALRVGGPETAEWNPRWTQLLMRHCSEQKLPLDFISWHYYHSTVGEIPQVRAQVDYWTRLYGLDAPLELIVGEWCWQINNFPIQGTPPWRTRNYYLNDWHAAFVGASLIEMQNAGVTYSIYTYAVAEDGGVGFEASGLMSATHPWANLNVFRLWSMLAPQIVRTEYDGRPGVFAQASRDEKGRLTVLLAHLRYRKDVSADITLQLNGLGAARPVQHYVVDDQHSNRFDAGEAHTELETVEPLLLEANRLKVRLRPRSVHLLVFE
jgi:alpha-L-arabinofuranosidase